jgi:hypothetical protein
MTTTRKAAARKPAERVFGVLCRRTDGVETRHSVRAASEADATAKVQANLADSPGWSVVHVEAVD